MKIVASFLPSQKIQSDIRSEFPKIDLEFYKGMENARASFSNAEVFLTYGEDLTDEDIQYAQNLKWIMVMSAGMDKMPFKACADKGVIVTNVRGIHKIPMAEFTLGTMLQYVKQTKKLSENEQIEEWDRRVPMGELAGKTLLVLGIGAIGGEIARLAKAFRMNVIGVNRSGNQHEFADITYKINHLMDHLKEADFIVSVLPSTQETNYLLNEEHFNSMRRSAVFINIGRGDLIEEEILLKVLKEKKIAHAFLDVFENEPLKKGHEFWKMENVTVTPHLSSITKEYLPRSFEIFKQNLDAYINKKESLLNKIDLNRGY